MLNGQVDLMEVCGGAFFFPISSTLVLNTNS